MDRIGDFIQDSEYKVNRLLDDIYVKLNKQEYKEAQSAVNKLIDSSHQDDSWLYVAYFYRGLLFQRLDNDSEAEMAYRKAIELQPNFAVAYNNLAQLLAKRDSVDEVEALYKKALELDAKNFKTFYNLAVFYLKTEKGQIAHNALRNSLMLDPDYQPARDLLLRITDLQESINAFEKILKKDPNNARLYCELAIFYDLQYSANDSMKCLEKMMELKYSPGPDFLVYFASKFGRQTKSATLAEKIFEYALELYPNTCRLYNSYSYMLFKQKKYNKALELIEKAISLESNNAALYFSKCVILFYQKKYDDSILSGKQSIKLNPKLFSAYSSVVLPALFVADWELVSQVKKEISRFADEAVRSGKSIKGWDPFIDLHISQNIDAYVVRARKLAAEIRSKEKYTSYCKKGKKDKIRVGYISPDFSSNHPVGYLIKDIFSSHDGLQFETFGFGLRHFADNESQVIRESFNHYFNLVNLDDEIAAKLIHDNKIDILVDLAGYSEGVRHGILSRQPAPIQIQCLGYTSSMQADWIQYYVSCREVVTKQLEDYFSEKIIYMPEGSVATRFVNNPEKNLSRDEFGLPDDSVVFCCFNKSMRINEQVFDSWMQILKSVPKSVLWLFKESESMTKNMNNYAENIGVDASRIIYLERCHLSARWHHQLADLWLDTFTLSAGTGSVLCANAGLPVLTLAGKTPQSRVGASIAAATNTSEMVCSSVKEYEKRAIHLGNHPSELAMLKEQLIKNRDSMPLFDFKRYIKHLELAYKAIHNNYLEGRKPETLFVEKISKN